MIFTGIEGQTVELIITNYQFPEENNSDWDGNWLNIYLNVKSNAGHWQTVDPSLTTWEVQELIDWFDKLSKNSRPEYTDMSFTEPNLSFELLSEPGAIEKTIKIKFEMESRPLSATDDIDYYVDIIADNDELKRLSAGLQNELAKFPKRKSGRTLY